MKKHAVLCAGLFLLLCSGCDSPPVASWRDIEELRPVEVLALDAGDLSVTATVFAQAEDEDAIVVSHRGRGVEDALAGVRNDFPRAQPYYSDIQYIIMGRSAAETGLESWLEWMERDPEMRLDAALFVAREEGKTLVERSSIDGEAGEKLQSLETELRELGQGKVVTVRAMAAALAENKAAICPAVALGPENEITKGGEILLPAGFALFSDTEFCGFIDEEYAPAVLLLLGSPQGALVCLETDSGTATLQLDEGKVIAASTEAGAALTCEVCASLIEGKETAEPGTLETRLAETLQTQLQYVLSVMQAHNCDFPQLLPGRSLQSADLSLRVTATVDNSYDLKQEDRP